VVSLLLLEEAGVDSDTGLLISATGEVPVEIVLAG